MNKEFAEKIYESIVENNMNIYKNLYKNTKIDENLIDYWKEALIFYNYISDLQKEVLFRIIEQTIIDTISSVFSILDNSIDNYNINISINNISTDNNLQDTFLEFIEQTR